MRFLDCRNINIIIRLQYCVAQDPFSSRPYIPGMVKLLFPIHIQNTTRTTASQRRHRFLRISSLFLSCTLLLLRPNSNFAMRLVVQRVKSASVTVDGKVVSSIGPGAMTLVGIHEHDTEKDLQHCAKRLLACKLWENDDGAMWRHGVKQRGMEVLCVSQFTLYGTLTKKHQPHYKHAMKSIPAQEMYSQFLRMLKSD
jgi:D-tyrosyl-tRNA(Tyr) deacylase